MQQYDFAHWPLHNLSNSLFSRCAGWWGHYTTHQDGGFVTEDLCTPVQCGEDNAVWAVHPCVWCLQNHQRESPRSPDRTRLTDDFENDIYVLDVYLFFLMEICMLFFTLCFSIRLWPFPLWRWSQERNLAWVWPNPGLLHAAKWSK